MKAHPLHLPLQFCCLTSICMVDFFTVAVPGRTHECAKFGVSCLAHFSALLPLTQREFSGIANSDFRNSALILPFLRISNVFSLRCFSNVFGTDGGIMKQEGARAPDLWKPVRCVIDVSSSGRYPQSEFDTEHRQERAQATMPHAFNTAGFHGARAQKHCFDQCFYLFEV